MVTSGPQIRINNVESATRQATWYRDLFGSDSFYFELQDHGIPEERLINETLASIGKELNIPLVATNNCRYLNRADSHAHRILMSIRANRNHGMSQDLATAEFYFKSGDEMRGLFDNEYPHAIENTMRIAESCNLEIDLPGPQFPEYKMPANFDSIDEYLRHLSWRGFAYRYPEVDDTMRTRLNYEIDTIIQMGYSGYFLIVEDFVRFARENDIPVGPGRGSGAGSLVAYCLRISDVDPLKYGLLFERFLNPERVSMPDFDIDFCYERRGEVIEYVNRTYGDDRVGQIITFGRLKARAVIRDVARALEIPNEEVNDIVKLIPMGVDVTLKSAFEQEPELRRVAQRGDVYKTLMDIAEKLEGLCRHVSTHAAGIVIGREPLQNYVPLYRDPKSGSISTQYAMDHLEDCGLVKMDVLGLKTLTLVHNTVELIHEEQPDFDIDAIAQDDKITFQLLGEGKSLAVFQFENPGMQSVLVKAKPACIEDLIALTSLYRPGPMENIQQFIDSKNGTTTIQYPLPQLKEALRETYGVIIYQEQVMDIVRRVAGFSLGQADILRRAMGKKKPQEMKRMGKEFINGAQSIGVDRSVAANIFELLQPFAGYGFNKSHAAAYSILAYQTAYLKAHWPRQFMAANLTNEINNPDNFAKYLEEARRMNIVVQPPNINTCKKYFSVHGNDIVYGMVGIKNVGSGAADEILKGRDAHAPIVSLEHLLENVDQRVINRKLLESCIQAGLFDGLGRNRATLFDHMDTIVSFAAAHHEQQESGQSTLFDDTEISMLTINERPEWPLSELLQYESTLLGDYFSGHPLDPYRDLWEATVDINSGAAESWQPSQQRHTILGTLVDLRTIQGRRGGIMAICTIEDFNGSMEIVAYDQVYTQYNTLLSKNSIVVAHFRFEDRGDRMRAVAQQFTTPERLRDAHISEIHICLTNTSPNAVPADNSALYELRTTLFDCRGNCPVYFHIGDKGNETVIRASDQLRIAPESAILQEIGKLEFVANIWKQ